MVVAGVEEGTVGALAGRIAVAWGGGASLEDAGWEPNAPSTFDVGVELADAAVWLGGEVPAELASAVASALGGGVVGVAVPPTEPVVGRAFRWQRADQAGTLGIYAAPSTFERLTSAAHAAGRSPSARAAWEMPLHPAETPAAEGSKKAGRSEPFPQLGGRSGGVGTQNIDLLLDVPLEITVQLGRAQKQLREILHLTAGAVIELDRLAGEPVDVLVNGRLLARGEVVVIDESFGIRVTDVVQSEQGLNWLA